jgi:hypothetical protein
LPIIGEQGTVVGVYRGDIHMGLNTEVTDFKGNEGGFYTVPRALRLYRKALGLDSTDVSVLETIAMLQKTPFSVVHCTRTEMVEFSGTSQNTFDAHRKVLIGKGLLKAHVWVGESDNSNRGLVLDITPLWAKLVELTGLPWSHLFRKIDPAELKAWQDSQVK